MFGEVSISGGRRKRLALAASAIVHLLVLAFLLRPGNPVFVKLSEVAKGEGGTSVDIYLDARDAQQDVTTTRAPASPRHHTKPPSAKALINPQKASHGLQLPAPFAPPAPKDEPVTGSETAKLGDTEAHAPRAGSLYGSLPGGPLTGPEIKPALPIAGENPVIGRADLPSGVEGTVIVEVTIDERGNIAGAKLVQKLGYGIDERVLAAVQQWRFRPATRDGVAIASQQLCVFHFPSGAG